MQLAELKIFLAPIASRAQQFPHRWHWWQYDRISSRIAKSNPARIPCSLCSTSDDRRDVRRSCLPYTSGGSAAKTKDRKGKERLRRHLSTVTTSRTHHHHNHHHPSPLHPLNPPTACPLPFSLASCGHRASPHQPAACDRCAASSLPCSGPPPPQPFPPHPGSSPTTMHTIHTTRRALRSLLPGKDDSTPLLRKKKMGLECGGANACMDRVHKMSANCLKPRRPRHQDWGS